MRDRNGGAGRVNQPGARLRLRCAARVIVDILPGEATLNWAVSTPIARWQGVTLGGRPQRVTRLILGGLTGEIPPELGLLSALETLELDGDLTGEIPRELGNLAALKDAGARLEHVERRHTARAGQPHQPANAHASQ